MLFSRSQLEELKSLQKMRERPNGVNIVSLALGQKVPEEGECFVVRIFFSHKLDQVKLKTALLSNLILNIMEKKNLFKKFEDWVHQGIFCVIHLKLLSS